MSKINRLLPAICWLIICISSVNLMGWLADIDVFKSGRIGLPSMKFNTSVCVLSCAIALLLFHNNKHKHFNTILPLNLIVLIISLLTLFEYVFKVNLKIDEFLVKEDTATISPGRMAVTSASCLALLAIGFTFIIVQTNNFFNQIAKILFYLVALVTFLAMLGYLLNVPSLHHLSLSKSMALMTALVLFPLSWVYISLVPQKQQAKHSLYD